MSTYHRRGSQREDEERMSHEANECRCETYDQGVSICGKCAKEIYNATRKQPQSLQARVKELEEENAKKHDELVQLRPENFHIKAENKSLKEKVESLKVSLAGREVQLETFQKDGFAAFGNNGLAKSWKEQADDIRAERDSIALELVAVREALKDIADKGEDAFAVHLAHSAINTHVTTLVAQIERRLEVAGKMAEAIYPMTQSLGELPMMQIDIQRARRALDLWNTANEGGKS